MAAGVGGRVVVAVTGPLADLDAGVLDAAVRVAQQRTDDPDPRQRQELDHAREPVVDQRHDVVVEEQDVRPVGAGRAEVDGPLVVEGLAP